MINSKKGYGLLALLLSVMMVASIFSTFTLSSFAAENDGWAINPVGLETSDWGDGKTQTVSGHGTVKSGDEFSFEADIVAPREYTLDVWLVLFANDNVYEVQGSQNGCSFKKTDVNGRYKVIVSKETISNIEKGKIVDRLGQSVPKSKFFEVSFCLYDGANVTDTYNTSSMRRLFYDVDFAKPDATKISKLTAGKKSFTVKWAKKSEINGYKIKYSTSSNMKKAKTVTVSKASTVSKKITGLKSGKKYYVQVQTFRKGYATDNNPNSDWSAKKSVKVK